MRAYIGTGSPHRTQIGHCALTGSRHLGQPVQTQYQQRLPAALPAGNAHCKPTMRAHLIAAALVPQRDDPVLVHEFGDRGVGVLVVNDLGVQRVLRAPHTEEPVNRQSPRERESNLHCFDVTVRLPIAARILIFSGRGGGADRAGRWVRASTTAVRQQNRRWCASNAGMVLSPGREATRVNGCCKFTAIVRLLSTLLHALSL